MCSVSRPPFSIPFFTTYKVDLQLVKYGIDITKEETGIARQESVSAGTASEMRVLRMRDRGCTCISFKRAIGIGPTSFSVSKQFLLITTEGCDVDFDYRLRLWLFDLLIGFDYGLNYRLLI